MQLARNRDGLHHLGEGFNVGVVVNAFEHQEADGAIGGRDEKRDIDERHVVADQQSAGFFREVVAADHAHAIDGARGEEKNQAAEPLGEQVENVSRGGRCNDGARDDDALGIEVDVLRKDEVDDGRGGDADERQKVGRGDDTALILFRRFVLDERIHRHGEESRPESQQAQ